MGLSRVSEPHEWEVQGRVEKSNDRLTIDCVGVDLPIQDEIRLDEDVHHADPLKVSVRVVNGLSRHSEAHQHDKQDSNKVEQIDELDRSKRVGSRGLTMGFTLRALTIRDAMMMRGPTCRLIMKKSSNLMYQ